MSTIGTYCFYCEKKIKVVDHYEPTKVYFSTTVSIIYYKEDKVAHLYFHPECFEGIAGSKYMEQLEKSLS